MQLYEIIPRLFIRGQFYKNKDKIESLRAANIERVVCLLSTFDEDLPALGISLSTFPLTDGKYVDETQVKYAVTNAVYVLKNTSKGVLVHCRGGKNRAGLVCTLIVAEMMNITNAEALCIVRKARPGAVNNLVFERYLLEEYSNAGKR